MSIFFVAVKDGAIKGVKTGVMLLKIMIPIYLLVVLIKYSPIMPWLEKLFQRLHADGHRFYRLHVHCRPLLL